MTTTTASAVAKVEPVEETAVTPLAMLDRAVAQGASMETLEKLMALQERWEANQARKAFDAAMASLREDLPAIVKGREVDYTPQGKNRVNYKYEDLPSVTAALSPVMAQHGLSFRWRTDTSNGTVAVTCIISHRDGHSEETTLTAAADKSGNKNDVQAIGSTITYLQRYTLKAAVGVAAAEDEDAQTADAETITADQYQEIDQFISERAVDYDDTCARFAKFFKVETLESLPATRFDEAMTRLKEWAK